MAKPLPSRLLGVFPGMAAGRGGVQLNCQIAWHGLTSHLRDRHETAELFVFGEVEATDIDLGGSTTAVVRHKWQAPLAAFSKRWHAPVLCFWHVGLLRLLP